MPELFTITLRWVTESVPPGEFVSYGSGPWWLFFCLILAGRACDLGSTFLATPHLKLEGNPIARRLGWRGGILLSLFAAVCFGAWPMIAISLATTSGLVAARNCQQAWLMRVMGEAHYRVWFMDQIWRAPRVLLYGCHWAEAGLSALPGVALLIWGGDNRVSLGVGLGITGYGLAVAFFTTLSLWRLGRR